MMRQLGGLAVESSRIGVGEIVAGRKGNDLDVASGGAVENFGEIVLAEVHPGVSEYVGPTVEFQHGQAEPGGGVEVFADG